MTERELKKLSRADLVEMMLALSKENQQLRAEREQLSRELEDRTITVENAGSLAEAALELNGVFAAAQAAAEQYLENLRHRSEQQDQICAQMEQETRLKCNRMVAAAKIDAEKYLKQAGVPVSAADLLREASGCIWMQDET